MIHDLPVDPFEFARELAFELDHMNMMEEDAILSALAMMNIYFKASRQTDRIMLKAFNAFIVPHDIDEVEFMTDKEMADRELREPIMKGKPHGFYWLGSLATTGFGLNLIGVSFVYPPRRHADTVFVPLESIDLRLAA